MVPKTLLKNLTVPADRIWRAAGGRKESAQTCPKPTSPLGLNTASQLNC